MHVFYAPDIAINPELPEEEARALFASFASIDRRRSDID